MAQLYSEGEKLGVASISWSAFDGVCMAVLALANELYQKGVLSLERYRHTLDDLRAAIPVEHAAGGGGTIFEHLIDRLDDRIAKKRQTARR